jgi:hypothetical protein
MPFDEIRILGTSPTYESASSYYILHHRVYSYLMWLFEQRSQDFKCIDWKVELQQWVEIQACLVLFWSTLHTRPRGELQDKYETMLSFVWSYFKYRIASQVEVNESTRQRNSLVHHSCSTAKELSDLYTTFSCVAHARLCRAKKRWKHDCLEVLQIDVRDPLSRFMKSEFIAFSLSQELNILG